MRSGVSTVVLCLAIAASSVTAAAATDALLCRTVRLPRKGTPAFRPFTRLAVADRLAPGGRLVDVKKPAAACVVVGIEGTAAAGTAGFLAGYATRPTRTKPAQPRWIPTVVDVHSAFGPEQLRVTARDDLLVPALIAADPDDPGPSADLDQFACYAVRARRSVRARTLPVAGAGAPAAVDVSRPQRLCVTADLAGTSPGASGKRRAWLCHAARVARGPAGRADAMHGDALTIRDRFGRTAMTFASVSELCVPATIGAPEEAPTATASPLPTAPAATPTPQATPSSTASPAPSVVSIRVQPESVVRMQGQSYTYTAIGRMSDGTERNLTEDVQWSCSFGCEAPNEPGHRSRVVATVFSPSNPTYDHDTIVWATDPATGIDSPSVRFRVTSAPVPLVIYPQYTIIRERTFDYLTALALDDAGAYRNATQDVIWSSSDPTVAAVTNTDGERSRVDGVSPGIATIYATDPRSGTVSAAATFDVFGPLRGIDVHTKGRSIRQTTETIDVGEKVRILAWSIFERGFTFEGFEPVTFGVSDPTVAVVEPVPGATPIGVPNGMLERTVRGLAPGKVRLSARDLLTGVGSRDLGCEVRLTVRRPVTSLRLNPANRSIGLGEIAKLTALGVGGDFGTRNYTQRVVYVSSNPNVIVATNEPGDRSKLVAVGPGVAVISAQDPDTGLSTIPIGTSAVITVRNEQVERITIEPPEVHAPLETFPRFHAIGHYPSGGSARINESVEWTSSNTDVAAFYVWGVRNRIHPFLEGSVVVSAVMPSLGLSSATGGGNATLSLEPIASLKVLPASATIPVDGETQFHVRATLTSGTEVELSADDDGYGYGGVALVTSDPTIARATSACEPTTWVDVFTPVLGRAPGSATIAARWGFDEHGVGPLVTSTATGGDAALTVTPLP